MGRSRPIVPHDDGDGEAGQGHVEAVALALVARGALGAALRVLRHLGRRLAGDGLPKLSYLMSLREHKYTPCDSILN